MANVNKFSAFQNWLATEKGKTIINYFYGFGAAIVILGALFKIMHFPGASIMLMLGMGTEVFLFCIGAFEKPHKDPHWEDVFPVLKTGDQGDNPLRTLADGGIKATTTGAQFPSVSAEQNKKLEESINQMNEAASQIRKLAQLTIHLDQYVASINSFVDNMKVVEKSSSQIALVSSDLAVHYSDVSTKGKEVESNRDLYVTRMSQLNESLSSLIETYDLQMKNITSQVSIGTDLHSKMVSMQSDFEVSEKESKKFKEESLKMAEQLATLNAIYAKMIKAMTATQS